MSTRAPVCSERRHWWLPSLSHFIWLAFFLGLMLTQWRLVLINADGDACLHWRIGNWMIEHRMILRADPFSHTRSGAPVVTMEWLSQLLLAAVANLLGWNGVVLLSAALIATYLWLLHRQLLSEGNELLLATGLVLVAAMACSMHWLARPHLVSHLLLAIWAWQLRGFEKNRVSAHQLFVRFVPLMTVWVNLHAGFLVGLMLIAVYFVGMAFRAETRKKMLPLGLLGASCFFASLLNPNGWRLHKYIVDFLGHPSLVHLVNEFRSPNFHSGAADGFLMMLFVLAILLVVVRPRLSPTDILLIGWSGALALRWVRNIPAFAILTAPILAEHFNVYLRNKWDSRWLRLYRKISSDVGALDKIADGRFVGALVVAMLLGIAAKARLWGGEPIIATELLTNRFPVAAVQYLKKSPDAVRGEMFNDYGWGGYLMLVAPDRKVFVDGRNDLYGETLLKEFNETNEVRPGWEAVFQKYGVGWTILPRVHALNTVLALHPGWRLVYADEVATIYGRVAGPVTRALPIGSGRD